MEEKFDYRIASEVSEASHTSEAYSDPRPLIQIDVDHITCKYFIILYKSYKNIHTTRTVA